jgi:hypothetical protein
MGNIKKYIEFPLDARTDDVEVNADATWYTSMYVTRQQNAGYRHIINLSKM